MNRLEIGDSRSGGAVLVRRLVRAVLGVLLASLVAGACGLPTGEGVGLGSAALSMVGPMGGEGAVKAVEAVDAVDDLSKTAEVAADTVKSTDQGASVVEDTDDVGDGAYCVVPPVGSLTSFTTSTVVLMGDGSHKPIGDVRVGDRVESFDPGTGHSSVETVTAVWPHTDEVWDVTLSDGSVVETTRNHPWWVESTRSFTRTDHLKIGDMLSSTAGPVSVVSVTATGETNTTYNLTVTGTHTYRVSQNGILVHNCDGGGGASPTLDFSKPNLGQAMQDRGWTQQDVQATVDAGPTGTSVDARGAGTTPDGLGRNDPATVYGQGPNNYVVVNDRTGEVAQVADRTDPGWVPDGRITFFPPPGPKK